MSDWKRTTKEVPFENFPPEMVSAVNQHIEQYNLGLILSDVLMCVQTDSEMVKKGLFDKADAVHIGAVVTPRWLVWAINEANAKTTVLSAQLTHVTVQNYAQTPFARMIPDVGIQVDGMFTDAVDSASAFIGLDEGVAGKKFIEVVVKAAQDAKK